MYKIDINKSDLQTERLKQWLRYLDKGLLLTDKWGLENQNGLRDHRANEGQFCYNEYSLGIHTKIT